MQTWLPTIISVLALGVVFFQIRTWRVDIQKQIDNLIKEREALKAMYLTQEEHCRMCEVSSLKIKEHVSTVAQTLKDDVCDSIDKLKESIAVMDAKIMKIITQHEVKAG